MPDAHDQHQRFIAKQMNTLETNPPMPLVEQLPALDGIERDLEAEDELLKATSVLIDGRLVRSGFKVPNSHDFFARVDRILRRSLGVSEHAAKDASWNPAPSVALDLRDDDDDFAFEHTYV